MLRCVAATLMLSAVLAGTPCEAARLLSTRAGETPRGSVRVVFETDRPVEFLTVELPSENGFEVHLLGVESDDLPGPMPLADPRLETVSFRSSEMGVVAKILGGATRLSALSFPLEDPHRVVVDLSTDNNSAARAAASAAEAAPTVPVARTKPIVAAKSPQPKSVAAPVKASGEKEAAPTPSEPTLDPSPAREAAATKTTAASPEPAGAPAHRKSVFEGGEPDDSPRLNRTGDPEFDDLIVWIHGLKTAVDALSFSETEEDRVRHRRHLAYLLLERNILIEAEKTLLTAVDNEHRDPTTAVADSVTLAEIRLRLSDPTGAADVARNVNAGRASDSERVRLAQVLLDAEDPVLAEALVKEIADRDDSTVAARASLLLARCHWDRGEIAEARDRVRALTSGRALPRELLSDAVLLHADCEFALNRTADAQALYARASSLPLSDEESAWVGLQLGNLARRDGRLEEAREHWRRAEEAWPETFYGSQAGWFLRFEEEMRRLGRAEERNSRG